MNIKSRILNRAKPKPVEFLSVFQEVTFNSEGVCNITLDSAFVYPIEAALLVPVNGTPTYGDTIGVSCTVDKYGVMTIDADDFNDFLSIGGCCETALISVGQIYNSRSIQQLLPSEVRQLTNGSAEVMQMLSDKDPDITDRLTKSISEKIGKGNDFDMGSALEAALNVELTLKHPELLSEIEMLQQMQPAIQLAVMIGADHDFMKTLYRYVPEGSTMINELVAIVDPPQVITSPKEDNYGDVDTEETIDVAPTAPLSALEDSLLNDVMEDDEEDLEPEEYGPIDDSVHGDYEGDTTDNPMLTLR